MSLFGVSRSAELGASVLFRIVIDGPTSDLDVREIG